MGSGPLFYSIQEKIAFRQEEQNLWSITFQNSQTFEQPNNGVRSVDVFLLGDQNKTGT